LPCRCQNSDPNSPIPPGGDGCVVNPDRRQDAVQQASVLREELLGPRRLDVREVLLLLPTRRSTAAMLCVADEAEVASALELAADYQKSTHTNTPTIRKEPTYGYL
jgi:hypothetical protein